MKFLLNMLGMVLVCGCQIVEGNEASGDNERAQPVVAVVKERVVTTPELLLVNALHQDVSSPAYRAQLDSLGAALKGGRQVRVSYTHVDGSEYFGEVMSGWVSYYSVTASMAMQNYQVGRKVVNRLNGFFYETIDTLGRYYGSGYLFGEPYTSMPWTEARAETAPSEDRDYITKWYADPSVPELLLRNQFGQDPQDSVYRSQLSSLKEAFRQGRKIRVTFGVGGFSQVVSAKIEADRVTAMLPMAPNVDVILAHLFFTNTLTAGSVDSLGRYWSGSYPLGSDTRSQSIWSFPPLSRQDVVSWYAD